MKKLYSFLVIMLLSTSIFAQDSGIKMVTTSTPPEGPWMVKGIATLNFNQAYFNNWAAGGESSLGLNALFNLQANYKKGKHSWANNIDLAYGFQLVAPGSSEEQMRKTDDKIDLTTSYGYQLSKHWDFTVLANFKTQFTKGYKYPDDSTVISNFMAPGYLVVGPGFTYKPVDYFSLFLSPASLKMTFVMDQKLADMGAFGVDSTKNIKFEVGTYVRATLNKDVSKNINITSTLDLYSDYLKHYGNIDVNWNLLVTLKVNSWLATTIGAQIIYDDDVMITDLNGKTGPRTQFRENIGVGISYKIH